MTQNKLTLGISSFLITVLALVYIFSPNIFNTPYAYAQGNIHIGTNEEGFITGIIQSTNSHPFARIPITITGIDNTGKLVNIATGSSDNNGKFSIEVQKSSVQSLKSHKIIILFTIGGIVHQVSFTVSLDDTTFNEIFVKNSFLPFPPFTVITY